MTDFVGSGTVQVEVFVLFKEWLLLIFIFRVEWGSLGLRGNVRMFVFSLTAIAN